MLKRFLCLLAAMMMLLPAALAENPSAEEGAFPALNEDGFLDAGEFVYINDEAGVWRYVAQNLKVEIYRCTGKNAKGSNLTWYEAEVWSRNGEIWQLFTNNEGKHMSGAARPSLVAQKNQVVLGINTDFAQARYPEKDNTVGIIIRDGKVFSDKTLKANSKRWPPVDVLALYPDGSMEVYDSDEHTAQEYLDMGVQSTLAFGPYLIRDGVRNDADISTMNQGNNPRTAIGMVEPGHTFAMMLEGRHKGSVGAYLDFLADRMLEKGCTLAFNLDGGQTACMLFMGEQINEVYGSSGKSINARSTTEVLGIGTSPQVTAEKK
ncbi:MAG: phosphodiester glycosidase family protein [Aristaeellaceae bacterium]